ncbi:MAG: Rossmann-like domain-containing protein [Bacillota bacterium]
MYSLLKAKENFQEIITYNNMLTEDVVITARGLTSEEAIGNPERDDFPLLQGKEVMIQAEFDGCYGQAFTDNPGDFAGSLQDVMDLSLETNYHRAVLVATINAVLRSLKLTKKTIHCKDEDPELCSQEMVKWIRYNCKKAGKIGIIGYQPAILEEFTKDFGSNNVFITDLNKKKIGTVKYGVEVWNGREDNEKLISIVDIILFTGSSIINDTMDDLITKINSYRKEYFIFGNTISGIASLLGLPQLCFYGD